MKNPNPSSPITDKKKFYLLDFNKPFYYLKVNSKNDINDERVISWTQNESITELITKTMVTYTYQFKHISMAKEIIHYRLQHNFTANYKLFLSREDGKGGELRIPSLFAEGTPEYNNFDVWIKSLGITPSDRLVIKLSPSNLDELKSLASSFLLLTTLEQAEKDSQAWLVKLILNQENETSSEREK